ncbi:MAG: indole-3-glycerol phosphate synthase TrpC [Pyrinomonadaceae bacterium]|nr:indole-3-glycerol phosphate synthase TrpC [Pyrinomonadaceae bacterium]
MRETFLEKVIARTRRSVAAEYAQKGLTTVMSRAEAIRSSAKPHLFRHALSTTGRINIIAEIKRASPSKGVINQGIDVRETALAYERGGAAAISVLTEPEYFKGSLDDLSLARSAVKLPLLRKDFTVDEYQIYEAAAFGADAVLLIVAALAESELKRMLAITRDLAMDAIVEVHTAAELEAAGNAAAEIIGINNRDLRSLSVSLDVSRRLISMRPAGSLMIAESGLSGRAQIDELRALGFDGFLIGETLMRSADPAAVLEEFGA